MQNPIRERTSGLRSNLSRGIRDEMVVFVLMAFGGAEWKLSLVSGMLISDSARDVAVGVGSRVRRRGP